MKSDDGGNLSRMPELAGLTPQQWRVALLIAEGRRVTDIAAETSLSRESIWRYRQNPGFAIAVDHMRKLIFDALKDRMWALGGHAFEVLHQSLDERDTDAALDIFKTLAPGLRDVEWVGGVVAGTPEETGDQAADVDGEEGVDEVPADAARAANVCPNCGLTTKSARGLTQHINRKHGGQ